ncbi:MAG: aryl-sulfate sulfotransferase [Chitinophagaceae bacterium]
MIKALLSLAFIIVLYSCRRDISPIPPIPPITTPAVLVISQDEIKLNPTGFAPLSAVVNYSYPTVGKTKIIVFGKNGANSNIEHVFNDNGSSHSVPIIGLYPNYKNTVEILLTNDKGDSLAKAFINIQTGALPVGMPTSIITDSAQYANMEPGLNLVSSFSNSNPYIPYMTDHYGDIRWLLDYTTHPDLDSLSYDDGISRLKNGNFYFGDETTSKIYEVDLLGKVVNSWGLSGYIFHHEVQEKPNGNFLISATNPSSTSTNGTLTIEDYVIEIDRRTGGIVYTWDLKESLDENRLVMYAEERDWMHINALFYDSSDNTIIVSGRMQGVVKLSYDNKVKWILGPHKDWGKNRRGENLNPFLLTPLDARGNKITDTLMLNGNKNHPDFEWSWFQHSPTLMPNGDLLLFDNGWRRNFNGADTDPYSRAVEYKIDPVKMTVRQVWQYGKERGIETYSRIVSNVQFLPKSNHVLFCPGFQVANSRGKGGKVVEVDYATGKAVFQSSISSQNLWGFHRTTRMSAYP